MRIGFAILLYVVIALSVLQNWLVLAGFVIVIFSIRHDPALLIPLAIFIDGYFGNYGTMPYLSFAAVGWFALVEYVRPKLVNFQRFSV